MRQALIVLLAVAATAPTATASAQEWQVARERFTFVGTRLTIQVMPGPAGNLGIIRGAPGTVRVASRAGQGFTAAGLSGDQELTLTAMGDGPVDYLVSVPEDVRVQVRLPGSTFGESLGSRAPSRTFRWEATGDQFEDRVPEWTPSLLENGPPYTTLARERAPAVVTVPDLTNVHSLSVRLQPGPFRAITSRPFSVSQGDDDLVEIRPGAPPLDLVLSLPPETRDFRLVAGGRTILLLQGDTFTPLCSPVTEQRLSDGRRWVTFTPTAGALRCISPTAPRHEG